MKNNQIDMTEGPIFGKLLLFSVPLIISNLLQLFFNAADVAVVGRFEGHDALAAVGSNGSLINLLINLFTGLSIGTNVVAAHFYGTKKSKELQDTVHTAIIIAVISGLILTVVGVFGANFILTLMKCDENVLELASVYLRIYFAGITATMVYNFGSALLRSKGDTLRTLFILFIAGVINVLLNLFFVIKLKMGVSGVAYATVISQTISAILVIIILFTEKDDFRLSLSKLKINPQILGRIIRIGVPAGFQGIMFSFSNVIIQTSVNSFGAILMAGNSAVINIEGFIYTAMNGFSQGALTFCSQNSGVSKPERIKKVVWISQASIIVLGGVMSAATIIFARPLIRIFIKNDEVIAAGMIRLVIIMSTYYLCGMMDSMANVIRGMGHSLMPVISSLSGACLFRIIWLFTIFRIPYFHTPAVIYYSYPISWILTFIVNVIFYRKYMKEYENKILAQNK